MALPAELTEHVRRISPTMLAGEQLVSVPELFHSLLPGGGLQRGWTVRVEGSSSARALAWALLSNITTAGRWVAAVNVAGISLSAASELGVAIERVLVIENAGADVWSDTIGALIGAVDVVLFDAPQHRVPPGEYRKIAARCRERGTVLMELEPMSMARSNRFGQGQLQYDVSFSVQASNWSGLGCGHGHLNARGVDVAVSGRRSSGRQRQASFELPTVDGTLRRIDNSRIGDGSDQGQRTRLTAVE